LPSFYVFKPWPSRFPRPRFGSRGIFSWCDKYGIGGDGEHCGGNDAQFGRINVLYHEAPGFRYVPRAMIFYLEHCAIGDMRASPLGELFRPG
jgi:hypothetical protein